MTDNDLKYLQEKCSYSMCPLIDIYMASRDDKQPHLKFRTCCRAGGIMALIHLWKELRDKLDPPFTNIIQIFCADGQWNIAILITLVILERCSYRYRCGLRYGSYLLPHLKEIIIKPDDSEIELFKRCVDSNIQCELTLRINSLKPQPTTLMLDYYPESYHYRIPYPFDQMLGEIVAFILDEIEKIQDPERITSLMNTIRESWPFSNYCWKNAAHNWEPILPSAKTVNKCFSLLDADEHLLTKITLCCWTNRLDLLKDLKLETHINSLLKSVDFYKCMEHLCALDNGYMISYILQLIPSFYLYYGIGLFRIACRFNSIQVIHIFTEKWKTEMDIETIDELLRYAEQYPSNSSINKILANYLSLVSLN